MKAALIVIIFSCFANLSYGQSFTSVSNIGVRSEKTPAMQAPTNPWLGAQVGYMYGGEEFDDDFLFSATIHKVIIESENKKFGIPLMGNLGSLKTSLNRDSILTIKDKLADIVSSDRGASLGLYPYWHLSSSEYSILFLIASSKLNSFEINSNTEYLLQGRIGVGYEYGWGSVDDSNKKRWIFSISPIYTFFNKDKAIEILNDSNTDALVVESSLIYALTDGVGVMVECNFAKESSNPIKLGIIYAFEKKK